MVPHKKSLLLSLATKTLLFAFLLIPCPTQISAETSYSRTPLKHRGRTGRFLFTVLTFRNDICNVTTDVQGVCYTNNECSDRGGASRASCAAGFGTCCVFEETCNANRDAKVAYFRNEAYPEVDSETNYCSYNLKVTDADVCQVRLDFIDFRMGGPSMAVSPFGQCSGDRMAIFAGQNRLGLSEGNLICGDMTDQHVYIPADATNGEDNLSLFAMVGTSPYILTATLPPTNENALVSNNYNYTWNIRIEQIDCTAQSEREAPTGCLQYFTESSGTLESFNFRDFSSPYPILMDYAICIKRTVGYCGLTLSVSTEGDGFGLNSNEIGLNTGLSCHAFDFTQRVQDNSSDFLQLNGAFVSDGINRRPDAYFCGVYDNTITDQFLPISTSFPGPLVIRFVSDESLKKENGRGVVGNRIEAQQVLSAGYEQGFRLTYALTPNCPV